MANSPLRVASIGYAFMGKAHSQAWRNVASYFDVPPVERAVLVGRQPDAVQAAATKLGWTSTATDWREVITRDDIDIVDVCAPGRMHAEIAIAALEAGKHVIVEKPIANSLAEAERMAEAFAAAESRGQHAIVNFNYRRVPALRCRPADSSRTAGSETSVTCGPPTCRTGCQTQPAP